MKAVCSIVLLCTFNFTNTVASDNKIATSGYLYNLGDSLTDQNNTFAYTGYLMNPSVSPNHNLDLYPQMRLITPKVAFDLMMAQLPVCPYFEGRFSDGPTYMELLVDTLDVKKNTGHHFVNMAYGGSLTISNTIFFNSLLELAFSSVSGPFYAIQQAMTYMLSGSFIFPSLYDQALYLINQKGPFNSKDIFVIASGANDNLVRFWNSSLIIETQAEVVRLLYEAGARIIFWQSLPDYTLAPCLKNAIDAAQIKEAITTQNKLLKTRLFAMQKEYPELLLLFVDTNKIFIALLEEAQRQGIETDSSRAEITFKGCSVDSFTDILSSPDAYLHSTPDAYFFFDVAHPGQKIHRWINTLVCEMLTDLNFDMTCPPADFDLPQVMARYFSRDEDPEIARIEKAISRDYCLVPDK